MGRELSIDLETYSDVDLIKCGVYAYADSPAFEVLLFAYSFDGEETKVIDLAQGEMLPKEVESAIFDENIIKTAFNANFERTCLSKYFSRRISPKSWHCSAVQAAMLALPRSLEDVGAVLGLEKQKMKEGKDLIRYFCVPCKPTKTNGGRTRNLPCHAPKKWELFKIYCKRDVDVEKAIRYKLRNFPIPESEMEVYRLDQEINDRGVLVDKKLVEQAVAGDLLHKEIVTKRAYELTGLENPNSVAQIKGWLSEKGLEIDSLSKQAVSELIQESDGEVEELLKLRLLMAKTSVKKYEAIERSVCSDGRVHGLLQFYGANRTGRWCLTGDHEILTSEGWKRLDEWQGGTIACWNPNGEAVTFQKSESVSFDYEGVMYEYNDKRISQISTPDHKMYVKRRYGGAWQIDIVENMQSYRPSIPFTGYRRIVTGMEHERLRVLIMVQADGHYQENGSIRFHFMKKRKIERCKHLLRRAGIPYVFSGQHKSGAITIVVYSRDVPLWLRVFRSKTFGTWLFDESADVFFEELANWDGCHAGPNSIQYSTCNKQNADMIQAFAHMSGRSAIIKTKKRAEEHPNWKDSYVLDIWLNPGNCHEVRQKAELLEYTGRVYCAVTPTGFFLVRRNGRVWVTGNSGKLVQVQNLPQNHIVDLELARNLVKQGRFEDVELLYDSTPKVLSELIRTAFIPKPGCRFLVADFSAIEARVLAWLSGEQWRLDVFSSHGKIYEASASAMFHVPIEEIKKGSPLRQKGKVAELACIAEGCEVLTDKGLVSIENVTEEHLLWDGEEWVEHGGVVYKGRKKVMDYGGLRATKDHLVWVEGKSEPIYFGEAARNGSSLLRSGNGGKPIWVGEDYFSRETVEQEVEPLLCADGMYGLRERAVAAFRQSAVRAFKGMSVLFPAEKDTKMAGQEAHCGKAEMRKSQCTELQRIRRQGDSVLLSLCFGGRSLDIGKCGGCKAGIRTGQDRQQWRLRAGKSPLCEPAGKSGKPKKQCTPVFQAGGVALYQKCCNEDAVKRDDKGADHCISRRSCEKKVQRVEVDRSTVRVYDIRDAGPRHRFTVSGFLVHNCGYGGGAGALKSMGALEMGVEEAELQNLINTWRCANPHITQFWWDVDAAAIKAVTEKKQTRVGKIIFEYKSGILFVTLPSGRKLSYVKPRMALNKFDRNGLTYEGIAENGKWGRIETYGPKLVENIVQGTARDLLAEAMLRLKKQGFGIVMHIHDEVVLEVPEGVSSVEEVCAIMAEQPEWAKGLPLRADGYECAFYKKD